MILWHYFSLKRISDNIVEKVKTGRQDETTPNASDQDGTSEADKMANEIYFCLVNLFFPDGGNDSKSPKIEKYHSQLLI